MGDLIQYDQVNREDTSYRPKDVSDPGMPPGNGGPDHSRDDMDGSSAKVIPDHLRVVARFKRFAGLGFVYHYTDFEGALGILRTGIINPTTNFAQSHSARGLKPGVSLSRRSDLRRYGPVRLTLDADAVRNNHKMTPFEFGASPRDSFPEYANAEEYVEGPLKILRALRGVDILKGVAYRRNSGDLFVEKFQDLTKVPIRIHESRTSPPAQRFATYDPTDRYYRLEPHTSIDVVIERWQSHIPRQKALDNSMPQDFALRDLWEYREYTWTRESSRPGYAKVGGKSVYLPGPLKWDALEADLQMRGWDIQDPLIVEVGSKGVKVGEGNHRLAIAKGLGLTKIPVRFIFNPGIVVKTPQLSDLELEIPAKALEEAIEKIPERDLTQEEQNQVDDLLDRILSGKFSSRTAGHPRGRKIDDILSHVDPDIRSRAAGISVKPLRFDPDQGFWSWSVSGSKGERYFVRLKGWGRSNKPGDLAKTPIRCSCTCNFWRWQGPEHWAKVNGYLYRTWRALPMGTMSVPHIRDPQGKHWVCKHLVAVLEKARKFKFASGSGSPFSGRLLQLGGEASQIAVAQRYASRKFYHGTSLEKGIRILREGFHLNEVGSRQQALYGHSGLDPRGVFVTSDQRLARWYAGSDQRRPGLNQEGLVIEVSVSGNLLPQKDWIRLKMSIATEFGVEGMWDPKQEAVVREAELRAQKGGFSGFWDNADEVVIFDPKSVHIQGAFYSDSEKPFQRKAHSGDAKQTAIALLRDDPESDISDLIERAVHTPKLYDEKARDFVSGIEVAKWLEKLAPKSLHPSGGFKVYHATSPQTAKLLLRRGFIPETKPRGIGQYAPGKGLETGLYVGATPRAVESYGRVVLEVLIPKSFLAVPKELAQLGETDPLRALRNHDGAVINHTIPPSSFQIVEGAHYLRG